MRFYTVFASRPVYYDRNPTTTGKVYGANAIAPHGSTSRWTYTVPTGRKSFVEASLATVLRDGAPGAVGLASAQIAYTPFGGSSLAILAADANNAAVGSITALPFGTLGLFSAGDLLTATTFDLSTGGTNVYIESIKYTEFDA